MAMKVLEKSDNFHNNMELINTFNSILTRKQRKNYKLHTDYMTNKQKITRYSLLMERLVIYLWLLETYLWLNIANKCINYKLAATT